VSSAFSSVSAVRAQLGGVQRRTSMSHVGVKGETAESVIIYIQGVNSENVASVAAKFVRLFFVHCFSRRTTTSSAASIHRRVASEPRFTSNGAMSAGSHQGRQDGGDATPLSQRRRQSPSPAPHQWSSGHNIIIKRVVEKSSAAIVYPTLIRTNYAEWALEIWVNLQDAIELGTDDYREDRSTLVALLRAVPEEMQAGLARKENTTEAWKAIRAAQMGGDRIKEATTGKLRRDFRELQFKAGECIDDFSLRVSTLANQL
jgi:hypothetical protein